ILNRYINRQLLVTTLVVTFVLVMVLVTGRFIKYLADAAVGEIAADALFLIMAYRLPEFLQLILPLSLYIGILLVLGGMYVTNEITVMNACGIGRKAIKIGRASCRAGAPEAVTGPRAVKQPGRPRAAPSVPSSDIA